MVIITEGEQLEREEGWGDVSQAAAGKLANVKIIAVAAGARILFYPTLFYNVVRNSLEQEFRWWDQIDQFLLLGAVPFRSDVLLLKNIGVRAVVTLNEPFETLVHTTFYQKHGIQHCVIPTRDYFFAPSVKDIRQAVNFIREHALRGEKTYVHCKAGRGRSTTVALCYLVEHRGMNPLEAFEYVRARRPRVLLAASQWEAVWEYTRQHCSMRLSKIPFCELGLASDQRTHNDECKSCLHIDSEELVILTAQDLEGYKEPERRWIIWKNLELVLSCLLSMEKIKKIKKIKAGCKSAQECKGAQGFAIEVSAY